MLIINADLIAPMPQHIFFSWQSDAHNRVGRSFIETCLERAIRTLRADADIEPADRDMSVDRDTLDVPGSPPIMETIFGKIDRAAVFLSDLTYVAERIGGGRTPNPNVCIEHGYALKALGWRRMVAVMNTAVGHPDQHELPFDVRHTRRPIFFDLPEDADADARSQTREALTKQLVAALKAILGDEAARVAIRGAAPAEPHPHDIELLQRVHGQLPLTLRHFLHQHSFGSPFLFAQLDPIHELNEVWIGAAYEFHDTVLQAGFADVRRIAADLGELVLERIHAMPGNTKMGWPKTNQDVAHGVQPRTEQAIGDMNAKATELSAAIDGFDRLARDRVRIASGAHAQATKAVEPDGRQAAAGAALNELALDMHRGGVPEIVGGPRLILRLAPYAAAEGRRLDPRQVAEMQLRFPPSTDVLVCSGTDGRQWWSCAPPRRRQEGMNPETTWMMRLVRPGSLEYQATIGERIGDDPRILIDGRRLEGTIVHSLERMAAIARGLDLDGPALVTVTLDGVEDVELTRARQGGRPIPRPEVTLPTVMLAGLAPPLASALHEQFDILWQSAGWADGSCSFIEQGWVGYADEGNYYA